MNTQQIVQLPIYVLNKCCFAATTGRVNERVAHMRHDLRPRFQCKVSCKALTTLHSQKRVWARVRKNWSDFATSAKILTAIFTLFRCISLP